MAMKMNLSAILATNKSLTRGASNPIAPYYSPALFNRLATQINLEDIVVFVGDIDTGLSCINCG